MMSSLPSLSRSTSTGAAKAPRASRVFVSMHGSTLGWLASVVHDGTSGRRLGQPVRSLPSAPTT